MVPLSEEQHINLLSWLKLKEKICVLSFPLLKSSIISPVFVLNNLIKVPPIELVISLSPVLFNSIHAIFLLCV